MSLSIKTADSIHEIDTTTWDQLSKGRPFQSHQWYVFGERVMSDCSPIYLLAYEDKTLIGRASMWLVRNEPLPPKLPALVRALVYAMLKRWPLLICRSPLASTSGLILPDGPQRAEVLSALTEAALAAGRQRGASIVLFDFLKETEPHDWPSDFITTKMSNPGAVMKNHWKDFDEYLRTSNAKNRKNYRRSVKEGTSLGYQIKQLKSVPNIDAALKLITELEQRHGSHPNPWARALLENVHRANGTWLEARAGDELIGGGLLFYDNGAQLTTALGLSKGVPYVYFLLLYESLRAAFENHVDTLHWGSGAFEVKQKLGFEQEANHYISVRGINWLTQQIIHALAN